MNLADSMRLQDYINEVVSQERENKWGQLWFADNIVLITESSTCNKLT